MGLASAFMNGREFEYQFEDPSEAAVIDKANELLEKNPHMTQDAAKKWAYEHIASITRKKTEKFVTEMLEKYAAALVAEKAEVGISRRMNTEMNIKDFDTKGLIVREVVHRNKKNVQVIPDSEVKSGIQSLVKELNAELWSLKISREEGNTKAGIGKIKDTVDLEIPTPDESLPIADQYHDLAIYLSGSGDAGSQLAQEMSRLNRFGKSTLPAARELTGYTFITRPHLNLSQANLASSRQFAPLLYAEPQSLAMAIRLSLDTTLAGSEAGSAIGCEYVDIHNPFLVMACNALQSISGFPDPNLSIETTEGGFFSEQQSSVIGYDRLAHGTDLQLQFRDYVGSPILALHDYWSLYMGNLGDGSMAQYTSDIEHNILGYTVSIYRFVMDPTNRMITRWAKATGCYPKQSATGAPFNTQQGEQVVQSLKDFSIPYQAHHFGYNDPIILKEFNMLVKRYNDWIDGSSAMNIRRDVINNRAGIPYIIQTNGFPELVWRYNAEHIERKALTSQPAKVKLTSDQKSIQQNLDKNLMAPWNSGGNRSRNK